MFRAIFTDIPQTELGQLTNSIVNIDDGKVVSAVPESDGSFTVIADFPGDPPPGLPVAGGQFPWMAIAEAEIGVKEGDNPRITEYFKTTSLGAQPDSVLWCSAFVNFCVTRSGNRGTNSAMARSWLNWGVDADDFIPGCIVVIERGSPPKGHVGFFVGRDTNGSIRLLGGNQSNAVNISSFPNARVLGKRTLHAANVAGSTGASGALTGNTGSGTVEPRQNAGIGQPARQKLINALIQVESRGNDNEIGDLQLADRAFGCLQIRRPVCLDVNQRFNTNIKPEDMLGNRPLSIDTFEKYMLMWATEQRIGRPVTDQDRARIWSGGPDGYKKESTVDYWAKVREELEKL